MPSLRGRLFAALLGIFIGAWMAVGFYLYLQLAQASSGSMDRSLEALGNTALMSMPSDIGNVSGRSTLSLPSGASGRVDDTVRSTQVWSKERRGLILRRAGAPSTPLKPDFIDGFATVQIEGEPWRVYAVSDASDRVQVQVGQPMSALTEELRTGLYYALGISSLAVLAVGLAVKLVVRWSFQPVMTVQSAMTSREALDLTPLPAAGLPSEVRPLVDSFNRLLERLDEALHAERRFIVEAAHELRTPLAVLLGQAQVARRARTLEEARPVLDQLVRGAERSARLSQQLLHSARVERPADQQTPIELADIVTVLIQDFEMMAAQKDQNISVHVEPGLIRGNLDELGILVSNLLDNALRYAGRGGHVAVRCVRDGDMMRLDILDDGPGVPAADRARIFDRFYRVAGSAESGSGIGLSLVARIARAHGASVSTGDGLQGRGFGIAVRFGVLEEQVTSS